MNSLSQDIHALMGCRSLQELLDTARRIGPYVDGYYIMTPFRRVELVKGIISDLKCL